MEKENEKKGLLGRLAGNKASKKSSCCSGFELEEIPEEKDDKADQMPAKKEK